MYGRNKVADQITEPRDKLKVAEIFASVQGEGPFSGERAIFIRLSGCGLRCSWCDTQWDDDNDPHMRVPEITGEVNRLVALQYNWYQPLVIITGGEPLLQPIKNLCQNLVSMGARIQIETAGTVDNSAALWVMTTVVVSPKTPIINQNIRDNADCFKYVISVQDEKCPETGIPITATQVGVIRKTRLALPPSHMLSEDIYLMPQEGPGQDLEANMKEIYRLCMKYGYKGSARLHTMMGVR